MIRSEKEAVDGTQATIEARLWSDVYARIVCAEYPLLRASGQIDLARSVAAEEADLAVEAFRRRAR